MSSVLIVGSVALDSVETPYGKKSDMLGGSATYSSLAASHFASVRLVAVVGNDFPAECRQLLESRKINLTGLQVVEGNTFRWSGEYHTGKMGDAITLDTQLNVFQDFNPMIPPEYQDSEWVFLGNIDPALQLNVLSQIPNPKLIALDTMNFWIENPDNRLPEVLKKVDLLIINEGELKLLTGKSDLRKGVEIAMGLGPKLLVVKLGKYGAVLFYDNTWFFAPAHPQSDCIDPTGAGDSFAGGLMGSLARDGEVTPETLRRAMVFGSVVASFNINDFGPWKLANLTSEQIMDHYEDFKDIVAF